MSVPLLLSSFLITLFDIETLAIAFINAVSWHGALKDNAFAFRKLWYSSLFTNQRNALHFHFYLFFNPYICFGLIQGGPRETDFFKEA
jgi:hypothetical protein